MGCGSNQLISRRIYGRLFMGRVYQWQVCPPGAKNKTKTESKKETQKDNDQLDSDFVNGLDENVVIIPPIGMDKKDNDAIEDGVTGYLANNEDEWVDKLSILIEDPILRNGMVNNAREDIFENYNIVSRVEQWDNIFKKLKMPYLLIQHFSISSQIVFPFSTSSDIIHQN